MDQDEPNQSDGPHFREPGPADDPGSQGGGPGLEDMRERFWERAALEGLELHAFLEEELARVENVPEPDRAEFLQDLRNLVEDVADTRLVNIALKAEDEGRMYAELASGLEEGVREERERLLDRLDAWERERDARGA